MIPTRFDGRKTRDEILADLQKQIEGLETKPVLAVVMVGDDAVSLHYVGLKRKFAERIGIETRLYHYPENATEGEVLTQIEVLNNDDAVNGIMIQIPVPQQINRNNMIRMIKPEKDVDGLRMCAGLDYQFLPPAVLSIEESIRQSRVDLRNSRVVLVGQGFLVGDPVRRFLYDRVGELRLANKSTEDITALTRDADIIISAVGQPGLIKPEMVKNNVTLIDAGTSEVGGELKGDIEPTAYEKASFYTPVPGGIGPVTIAYLMKNVVSARWRSV